MMLVVGLLAVCTVTVLGISSGNTTMCDAHSVQIGCTQWGTKVDPNNDRLFLVNRLNCTMNGTRLMAWVAAPVRTDAYTVRSGNSGPISNDVAFYQPGEYVTITVRSHVYKQQYLGLLMYAVNASGQVVGNFAFAPESQAVAFWTPSAWASVCGKGVGNAVLHANAAPKPYTMNFRWKAPPAGTGTVTFKALFKSGPANEGEFWFPNNAGRGDLVLSERNTNVDGPVPQQTWFKATSASQTCAALCTANGRAGVDSTLMAQITDGGDGFSTSHPSGADAYYRSELCRAPFVSSCAPDSPGIDTATSFCYFQPAACPSWRNLTTIPTRRRLCACLAATTQAVSPCPADQGWPSTATGATATLPCAAGQNGSNTRACSTSGVWGTAVNTCATVATCSDKILNQGEINIDCGGPCPACPTPLYCPTINCGSHGTCVEQNPPACSCNNSWTGSRCDVPPPNPCDTWTCANGATCQVQSSAAVCLCVGTWTGPHCDQLPAATCTDGVMNQNEVGVDCGGPCPACATYFWDMGLWSTCDRKCGGGTQTRGLTCTNSTGQVVASSLCASLHAPITSQSCNPDPCPVYTWTTQSWEACNTVCGGGVQTRKVECWSSVGPSIVTTPGLCTASLQPATSQACNTPACSGSRWVSDPWGTCSLECGGGTQTRANRCMKSASGVDTEVDPSQCTEAAPSTSQPCNVVPCVTYDWFLCPNWGPCTASCGGADGMKGQAYRDLFCESSDGVQVDFSLCDPVTKPSNVLTVCNTWPCTDFNWMANGDWGPCNGTHRTRGFHCHAANGALALDTQCKAANIPYPLEAIPCTAGKVQCYDVPPTPMFGLSAAPKMQTSLPFVLAAIGSLWSSPRLGVLSVALLGLSLVAPAEAHNWLHTPGRASFQASTVAPCQARKDSDLHAQVIPGQDFTIKFATGHDRPSYFVSIRGEDADIMGADNFEDMVDDYLTIAKNTGVEDHLSDMNRRYHGYYVSGNNGNRANQGSYDSASDPIGSMYQAKIDPSDPRYPFNARSIATGMYVYKDSLLANDLRASYQSAKYPWILGAARLPHLYHLPDDFDGFHWRIPSWAGTGHVIVHWRWSGYYDCIDVDVRTGTTPVAKPDGIVNASNHVWSQIDHCQYESPINILTQCMEVIDTVQPCINALGQGDWNVNNRLGLNVVPFRNPATVNPNFAGQVYIPWRNGACSSSWNRLPGTISETMLDWTTWLSSKTTVTTGTKCSSQLDSRSDLDLKRAVGYCVGMPTCTGIAWDTTSGSSVQSPGAKQFVFCSGSGTSASSTWNLYQPKNLAGATYQTNPTFTINFAPPAQVANTAAQTNMVTDAGYPYGARNGQTYGWSCKGSVGCSWCCDTWQCANGALAGCCSGNIDFTYNYGANLQCPDPDPDGVWKYFNYAVANGVYQVTTRHQGDNYLDVDIGACNIEGVRLVKGRNDNTPAGVQLTTQVEVTDGKLTFNGDAGVNGGCWFTNWIKFSYQGPVGTWPQTWMPPAVANPVWEQNVGSPQAIGLVTIQNYDWFTNDGDTPACSSWWLFKGNACYPNKASGWFNDTSSQGALVGVSNVSCLTSNCAGFVTCGWVQRAADLWSNLYFVDCNGVVGQYVFVKLPGSNRYLTLNIQAYLYQPVVSDNPLVCYGLEARPATATYPEFIISSDPEDPIFYSTCYARNPDVIWLPTPAPPPPPSDWRFSGRCVSCDSYNRNSPANKLNFASLPVPWVITDGQCVDCANDQQPLDPVTPLWIQTYSSQCDDPADPNNKAVRGLPPCAGSGFTSCNKDLYARGRTNSESTWGSAKLTYTECQHLAANDPDCGPTISYYDGGGWSDCSCYRAHPCCGKCTPGSWSNNGKASASPQQWHQVYDSSVSPVPDPFCSTGIKDVNSTLCCPATCKDTTGKNICGVQWQCSNVAGGGTCCRGDGQNLFVNMCTARGPPCKLK